MMRETMNITSRMATLTLVLPLPPEPVLLAVLLAVVVVAELVDDPEAMMGGSLSLSGPFFPPSSCGSGDLLYNFLQRQFSSVCCGIFV